VGWGGGSALGVGLRPSEAAYVASLCRRLGESPPGIPVRRPRSSRCSSPRHLFAWHWRSLYQGAISSGTIEPVRVPGTSASAGQTMFRWGHSECRMGNCPPECVQVVLGQETNAGNAAMLWQWGREREMCPVSVLVETEYVKRPTRCSGNSEVEPNRAV